jgi:hypothetical protein
MSTGTRSAVHAPGDKVEASTHRSCGSEAHFARYDVRERLRRQSLDGAEIRVAGSRPNNPPG